MNILKANDEQREFVAAVYRAGASPDAQGDVMDRDELHLATMRFASNPRIKIEHGDEEIHAGLITVLGSWMTGNKASGGLPKHAWCIHGKVARGKDGDVLWSRIKAGRRGARTIMIDGREHRSLTGFSMGGEGLRVAVA